jgi:Uncharacterized protein conserved in bacteria
MQIIENQYALNAKGILQFNDIYFGVPHNQMFKLHYMREWMEFYGYWLAREKNHQIPKYYTKFKHGSVVMVNFGPNVGSELSGNHFAIVLNKVDKRENKLLTVVPLSSKDHSNYLDLGYEFFKLISDLTGNRLKSLAQEQKRAIENMSNVLDSLDLSSLTYNFKGLDPKDSSSYLVKDSLNGFAHAMKEFQTNFNSYIRPGDSDKLQDFINRLVNINDKEFKESGNKQYKQRISSIIDTLAEVHKDLVKYELVKVHIDKSNELVQKMKRYSKNTYVVIPNVTTVSKLRVVKVGHYTISKNVTISEESLTRIHKSVKNYLNLND